MSLTHLAHAFVLEHPAVTSAIIGPRTMEQLDDALAGADVRLDAATLDAIDEIVPPGTDVSGGDPWQPPGLATANRRRASGQLVGSVLRSIRPSSIAPVNPPSAMRSKPFT